MDYPFSIRGLMTFLSRAIIILSVVFVSACGDDDDNYTPSVNEPISEPNVPVEEEEEEEEPVDEVVDGAIPFPQEAQEKVYSFVTVEGRNLYWNKRKADRALDIIRPNTKETIKLRLLKLELPKLPKRRLEANGVRVVIPWSELQSGPGAGFDSKKTAFYKDLIDKIVANGMEPMISFGRAPKWVKKEGFTVEQLNNHLYTYLSGVTELVLGINSEIRHIQLWDEQKAGEDFGELTSVALVTVGNYVRETMPGARTYLGVNADKKQWLSNTRDLFASNMQLGNVVDVVGINYYPGAKTLLRGLALWKPLDQLAQDINDSESPLFGKMGAVMETGYSTYGPGHGKLAQSAWIGASLERMISKIKKSTGYEHKIVAWNWNQFSDTPWLGRLKTGLFDSNYGITLNNVGVYVKKIGFGALHRKISKANKISLYPEQTEQKVGFGKIVDRLKNLDFGLLDSRRENGLFTGVRERISGRLEQI